MILVFKEFVVNEFFRLLKIEFNIGVLKLVN